VAKQAGATGLDSMMTSTEVAEKIADGEYEEARPSRRGVKISTDPDVGARTSDPPYLTLLQGQSKAVQKKQGSAGQFKINNFQALDEITLIPVGLGNFRQYRADRNNPSAPITCESHDGVFGEGDPGGLCAQCPLSQWGPRNPATGKSTRPPCTEGVMLAAVLGEYRQLVLFPLRSASVRLADDIRAQARFHGFGNFAVKMGSEYKPYAVGGAHVPVIEFLPEVPPEWRATTAKAMAQLEPGPEEGVIDVEFASA
jgi:hypothetical protein